MSISFTSAGTPVVLFLQGEIFVKQAVLFVKFFKHEGHVPLLQAPFKGIVFLLPLHIATTWTSLIAAERVLSRGSGVLKEIAAGLPLIEDLLVEDGSAVLLKTLVVLVWRVADIAVLEYFIGDYLFIIRRVNVETLIFEWSQ